MLARLSLKFKLTTFVVVLVAFGTYLLGGFAFQGIARTLEKAAGVGVLTAAHTFARLVDREWLTAVDTDEMTSQSEYVWVKKFFEQAISDGYVRRVEIVRLNGRTVEHILNEPADGDPEYVPAGTTNALEPGSIHSQTKPGFHVWESSVTSNIYIAGWVPITNGDQVIGVVTAYIDGTDFQTTIDTMTISMVLIIVVITILAGLVTYRLAVTVEKTTVTDGLMGIYNHKYFKQRLEQEVSRSRRYGHNTSLVLLDIDFFKRVNDTYGHTTGDIVLKNLAKWISDSCRTTDVVCRYGGEEIVVILTHTGIAGAQEYAERLRIKISQQVNKDPGEGAEFRVTVSVGVAQYEKGMDMIGLIKRADAALYHSKHTGRNRVTVYTDEIPLDLVKDKQNSRSTDR